MTTRFSRRAMACALLATSFLASGAAADIAPPPQHNSVSPMGVSYSNGAFNLSETDLSIGGEGNAGLSFTRTYNSATGGLFSDFLFTPGWTHNFTGAVTQIPVPTNPDDPPPQHQLYTYTVSFGGRSASFAKGLGTYIPDEPNGSSLIYVTSPSPGHYTFTDSDGSVANFTDGQNGRLKDVTFPDGTRWEFVRDSNLNLQRVTSNRGYAMIVEYLAGNARKICAVNLAETYWTSSTSCPAGGRSVTYGYTNSTYRPSLLLLATKTDTAGQVTSYGYNFYEHVNCIKEPGQSICRVQNTYSTCPEDPNIPGIEPDVHLREGVLSQTTADGKQYSYSYDDQYVCTNG